MSNNIEHRLFLFVVHANHNNCCILLSIISQLHTVYKHARPLSQPYAQTHRGYAHAQRGVKCIKGRYDQTPGEGKAIRWSHLHRRPVVSAVHSHSEAVNGERCLATEWRRAVRFSTVHRSVCTSASSRTLIDTPTARCHNFCFLTK